MKEEDIVIITKPFWGVDYQYIGQIGTLSRMPTEGSFGVVLLNIGVFGFVEILIVEGGCILAPSLIKELF